jgi:Uma2 family endonuclease
MATAAQPGLVTVEDYLKTVHEPDCELVNGYLQERNLGEYEHSEVQGFLVQFFRNHAGEWNIRAVPECRMQVSPANFRIPDVMVLRAEQKVHRIVTEAPLICIEVLSPEDSMSRMEQKVRDYVAFGVKHIWFFDPETRMAYSCDAKGFHTVQEEALAVPGTPIRVVIAEVFSVLG